MCPAAGRYMVMALFARQPQRKPVATLTALTVSLLQGPARAAAAVMRSPAYRDAHAKTYVPLHNKHPADCQLSLEKSVHQHFHCPFNERNYFQNSATEGDLFFLRDFDRMHPYKSERKTPRKREEFEGRDGSLNPNERVITSAAGRSGARFFV